MPRPPDKSRKQPVTLSIRGEVLQGAKDLDLNISSAAEEGIALAVKRERERQWKEENKAAIEAYNERIRTKGLFLNPYWLDKDGAL